MTILPENILSQIQTWLDRLKSGEPFELLKAATGLRDLARTHREPSSVRMRGSLSRTANCRVTAKLEMQVLAGAWDNHLQVRTAIMPSRSPTGPIPASSSGARTRTLRSAD